MVTGDDDTPRRGSSEPSPTLFVKNLWYNTTEADLKEKFEDCTRVRIPVEQDSDRNRGWVCIVPFHDSNSFMHK